MKHLDFNLLNYWHGLDWCCFNYCITVLVQQSSERLKRLLLHCTCLSTVIKCVVCTVSIEEVFWIENPKLSTVYVIMVMTARMATHPIYCLLLLKLWSLLH